MRMEARHIAAVSENAEGKIWTELASPFTSSMRQPSAPVKALSMNSLRSAGPAPPPGESIKYQGEAGFCESRKPEKILDEPGLLMEVDFVAAEYLKVQ